MDEPIAGMAMIADPAPLLNQTHGQGGRKNRRVFTMPLTYQPFAEIPEIEDLRHDLSRNVSDVERVASVLGGAAMFGLGLRQRSLGGIFVALLGGMLIHRGATGHCQMYEAMGVNPRQRQRDKGVPDHKGTKVVKTVTIARPRDEVYRFWRKLENLPRFMRNLESVQELDQTRSHWKAKGPMGRSVEWTAEIINEREGKMIAWQSLPGAELRNAGSVWFEDTPGGTQVKVALEFDPPAGVIGDAVAMLADSPEQQLTDDLEQFKNLVETYGRASANVQR